MTSTSKSWPYVVIYDPDAVAELLAMKSKEEHRALLTRCGSWANSESSSGRRT